MMKRFVLPTFVLCTLLTAMPSPAAERSRGDVEQAVAQVVGPVMQRYGIPGMAVGVAIEGRALVFDFGVRSKATGEPVTENTLFELGSVSKTFTATLASYAAVKGRLSLSDPASTDLPALRDSAFDHISLLNLGTHTPGGMPLQFPDDVTDDNRAMAFFRSWKPSYAPGTTRTYANPSIGLLGLIAATRLNGDYRDLVRRELFRPLGMEHAFFDVPPAEMTNYAQGYTKADAPVRMAPGALAAEAYGIRTTAADLLRSVEANMGLLDLPAELRAAIGRTHTGYFTLGAMTQDLIWEQYRTPVTLADLQEGNSAKVGSEAIPVTKLDPPLPPQADVLLNKTGSTNGFASYVAFVPGKRIGVVLLANKNYPIPARVAAAFEILKRVDDDSARPVVRD